jgi:hypothetical protein
MGQGRRQANPGPGATFWAVSVDEPEWQRAATAFYQVRDRVLSLQRRILFAPVGAAVVLGALGMAAHISGYWAMLGVDSDGMYLVNAVTVTLAFLTPGAPIVAGAYLVYRYRRRVVIQRWLETAQSEHSLSRAALEERLAGL